MYTLFKVMTMETWPDLARHAGKVSPGLESRCSKPLGLWARVFPVGFSTGMGVRDVS